MDPLNGIIGGRYALCGELASGGMATVHLARQLGAAGFARIVAVKRLHERYARDPEFVAMFVDEARLVARIRHPNVVQTIDVVAERGELFLVMEYVHGESLLRVAQRANKQGVVVPVPVTAAIFSGVLHGLHEAHEARSETGELLQLVHRDVSPHNILVGADGAARVLDFGVAKASQRIQTTQQGQLKGKLAYMAPEQISDRHVDRRTDVYAAAVCLWEMLTGAKLFQASSEAGILNRVMLAPVDPPSMMNGAVSPALEAVVMRGLARDPSERFATAREMALALECATTLATPAEVGEVVARLCARSLSARSVMISAVELKSSSSNLRDAVDSLRTLTTALPVSASPATPAISGSVSPSGPIETVPPLPFAASIAAHGTSMPPPAMLHSATRRQDAASNRVIAAVAASVAMVAGILVLAGYLLVVKRGAPTSTVTTSSATLAEKDGAADGTASSNTTGPTVASAQVPSGSCPDGMAMVPGGRFFMGSDDDLPAERPAHKVTLHAYCMDKLEVTTEAYRACSDRGDCKRAGTTNKWDGITAKEAKIYDPLCNASDSTHGRHPVNCVDWMAADRFCKAEKKRLPTEAEWEFAARGSDGRKYPWGDAPPSVKHLNACGAECTLWGKKHGTALEALFTESDPFATTAPVGSFPQGVSRWGIEDLVGNVWEWTADYYADYTGADAADPTGPATGASRVMRGGGWNGAYADWVRPSFRFHDAETTRSHGVGFRCAAAPL